MRTQEAYGLLQFFAGAPSAACACRRHREAVGPPVSADALRVLGKDLGCCSHLLGEMLAGFGFPRPAYLLLCLSNGGTQISNRLMGLRRDGLQRLSLGRQLGQQVGHLRP